MIISNWHKLPLLRWILCKIGRHDYEFVAICPEFGDPPYEISMECFYCLHKKRVYAR